MNDTHNAPRTAQQALRHARCFDKAKMMQAEGYRASTVYTDGMGYFDVYKPGNFTVSDYSVHVGDRTCTCPDFDTYKDNCKHILFVNIIRAEQADDTAMWESICARHDADNMELPEPKALTVSDVLESLQKRIVQELDAWDAADKARKHYMPEASQIRLMRQKRDLDGALNIINRYWGMELCNGLDLAPADADSFNSGWEAAKDLLDGRI